LVIKYNLFDLIIYLWQALKVIFVIILWLNLHVTFSVGAVLNQLLK